MSTTPRIARVRSIRVYPLDYFDGVERERIWILPDGRLQNDSQFVLVNEARKPLTLETRPEMLTIRAVFDTDHEIVVMRSGDAQQRCVLTDGESRRQLERWLSNVLGERVFLEEALTAAPGGEDAVGPTIVSTSTLREVASWCSGASVEEIRQRARANIELEGVEGEELEPFWEERLAGPPGEVRPFKIGESALFGTGLIIRGSGFARHPITGAMQPRMLVAFKRRRAQVPTWSPREWFNGRCLLGVQCKADPSSLPSKLAVGDLLMV